MKKIVVIFSLLIYLGELIGCISSIKEFGVVKNFAILWFFPFVVQIVCYALLLFKRFSNSKIVLFVTIFAIRPYFRGGLFFLSNIFIIFALISACVALLK